MKKRKPVLRILIVEDDPERARRLQSWLLQDARTVVVASAGRTLGVLHRDRGSVYAGILLDHDLQKQAATDSDRHLSIIFQKKNLEADPPASATLRERLVMPVYMAMAGRSPRTGYRQRRAGEHRLTGILMCYNDLCLSV